MGNALEKSKQTDGSGKKELIKGGRGGMLYDLSDGGRGGMLYDWVIFHQERQYPVSFEV